MGTEVFERFLFVLLGLLFEDLDQCQVDRPTPFVHHSGEPFVSRQLRVQVRHERFVRDEVDGRGCVCVAVLDEQVPVGPVFFRPLVPMVNKGGAVRHGKAELLDEVFALCQLVAHAKLKGCVGQAACRPVGTAENRGVDHTGEQAEVCAAEPVKRSVVSSEDVVLVDEVFHAVKELSACRGVSQVI